VDFHSTDLTGADLTAAGLNKAILAGARLTGACLDGTSFAQADLFKARLTRVNLSRANLTGADLAAASLIGARMTDLALAGAIFSETEMAGTVFGDVDLSTVRGLDTVRHLGPSTMGIDTLYRSQGHIPEVFLRGAGVPEDLITYVKSLVGRRFEFYSCFISYNHTDKSFARRLHNQLRGRGIRTIDEEDLAAAQRRMDTYLDTKGKSPGNSSAKFLAALPKSLLPR
jgi:hypothetical protein